MDSSDALFAWLHVDGQAPARDLVAVICAPHGHEYTHAHRSVRHLADVLARAGIATLRFDYHGTGNSPGSDLDPGRVARWQDDIRAALAHARAVTGRSRAALVGLRLGALLAAEVAATEGVELLALLAPVSSGRRYVRELQALAAASPLKRDASSGIIDAAGFPMSAETAAALKSLALRETFSMPVLMAQRDDLQGETARVQGAPLEEITFEGFAAMVAEPQFTEVPAKTFARVVEWLRARSVDGEPLAVDGARLRTEVALADGTVERCLNFGEEGRLFGVLATPGGGSVAALSACLFNAGSVHHVGPNRLYVEAARELARDGIASLRVDILGLGDSVAPHGVRENHPYPEHALANAREALRALERAAGTRRLALVGLCSGAHTAFHAACSIDEHEIVETVLINPLTYRWVEGMTLETTTRHFQEVAYYKNRMRDPRGWLKVLTGKVKFRRAFEVALAQLARVVRGAFTATGRTPLAQDLRRIFDQRRTLRLFIARGDPGYDLMNAGAKPVVRKGLKTGKIGLSIIEDADHTFSTLGPRRELLAQLREHLGSRVEH